MQGRSQCGNRAVTPKEKHIPADAGRTSVCFTLEERAAIRWISDSRKREPQPNKRTTLNDIVVDAIWDYLDKYGRTRGQIEASVPPPIPKQPSKIAQMPKKKR